MFSKNDKNVPTIHIRIDIGKLLLFESIAPEVLDLSD